MAVEKRLVDVALRYDSNPLTLRKWQAICSIEREFSAAHGTSIYAVLPGVVENLYWIRERAPGPRRLMDHLH